MRASVRGCEGGLPSADPKNLSSKAEVEAYGRGRTAPKECRTGADTP